MKKKTTRKKTPTRPKFDPPIRALGLHIAGLRAGILEHKPEQDSLAMEVCDLLGRAAAILLTPPDEQK